MATRFFPGVAAVVALAACTTHEDFGPPPLRYDPLSAGIDYGLGGPDAIGETISQVDAPPPISGGTLSIVDARVAVAADPDRDVVYLVDLASRAVVTVPLRAGDEPGRVAVDPRGVAHVALRSGGAIVSIDVRAGRIVARRAVCAAPRGLAYDAVTDAVMVACVGGELASLPAAGGDARLVAQLDRDLRDVVVTPDELLVSRFRTPELLHLTRAGVVSSRERPDGKASQREPAVAWRTIPLPGGGAAMVHHLALVEIPPPPLGSDIYYYGPPPPKPPVHSSDDLGLDAVDSDACPAAVVDYALTVFPLARPLRLGRAVLPVDVAASPDGRTFAIVAAGNAYNPGFHTVYTVAASDLGPCAALTAVRTAGGETTAVAYAGSELVVFSREPATLHLVGANVTIQLSASSRKDTGHALFHANTGALIACASCHAEGGDDGRVWHLLEGVFRTPSLRGTIAGTAPYHWRGELPTLPALYAKVMVGRMGASPLDLGQASTLTGWLEHLPAPPPLGHASEDARTRGQALFEDPQVGCSGCHGGASRTNDATVDVGTGGAFQVPSLVGLAWRAPFLHDGCAASLHDRFECGGTRHGDVTKLSPADLSDLVGYLETL